MSGAQNRYAVLALVYFAAFGATGAATVAGWGVPTEESAMAEARRQESVRRESLGFGRRRFHRGSRFGK